MTDLGLYIAYVLLAVAIGASVILPLVSAFTGPGHTLRRSLYAIGALVVVAVVSYAAASSTVTTTQAAAGVTHAEAKLIGGGLILLYVVFIVAIIGLIFSEINKAFK